MFLLADGAQSFGALYQESRVGALAPATALNFFRLNRLGATATVVLF